MLEWTGERYLPFIDPSISGAALHYEHLHRYAFASQYVKNKKVLDLASGEGFGSSILSKTARCVVGIDIDHEAVLHASGIYKKENITFIEGSILDIPIEGRNIFDVVVCFEAIEHVSEHDLLLREIGRLLKDDGILIISTPNKKTYSDETDYRNPYHQKELYYSEFYDLLKRNFAFIYLSGQRVFSGSSIYPITSEKICSFSEFVVNLEGNQFSFSEGEEKQTRYFIAIASNVPLDPNEIQKSYLVDKSNAEVTLLNNQIEQYNAEVRSLNQATALRDQQIAEMTEKISRQDTQVTELANRTHTLDILHTNQERQISELSKIVNVRDEQVTQLKLDTHNLETMVTARDNQISQLKLDTHNLETMVTARDNQVTKKTELLHSLEAVVAERDTRIREQEHHLHSLETMVAERDDQIKELKHYAHNLETLVTARDNQVNELKHHARNLETLVTTKKQQLQKVIGTNQALSRENTAIKQSLTYNLTTRFHKKIVERLLPKNTRRRTYYDLGISGSRILINEGWDRLLLSYHERKHPRAVSTVRSIPQKQPKKKVPEPDIHPVIQTKVSVIIPTKNAGADFGSVLEKIKNQKGIGTIEIIIVDSGSSDHTRDTAKKAGCRVFEIRPEEFNHGLTRNYGAEQASGDYIVFLVQDAIPIGEYWLYHMVKFFGEDKKMAAVTCRQVPRSDADLFAGFILWYHNRSLNRTHTMMYSCTDFDTLTPLDKRIAAGIEDTCCMMQREIFNRFRFRDIPYGEDLDIGIRLLKSGNNTAFLFTTGVIHSHNRDPFYFFKRSFIDTQVVDSLLNGPQKPADTPVSLKDLMEQILGLYALLRQCIPVGGDLSVSGSRVIDQVIKALQSPETLPENQQFFFADGRLAGVDSTNMLEVLLADCAGLVQADSCKREGSLIRRYCSLLENFSHYCEAYSSLEGRESELSASCDKLFALVAGSTLGTYFCHTFPGGLSETEAALRKKLEDGV